MGLKGKPETLDSWKKRIQKAPIELAQKVASDSAPKITNLARGAYDSGRKVWGELRPPGAGGRRLTLKRTGDTYGTVRFVAIGTIMRCVLGTPYARYLIGKYGILPSGAIPYQWGAAIRETVEAQSL
jgi:hypothetical protein